MADNPAPRTAPDWSQFTSYYELANAARECDWLTSDGFFEGPFKRFLELCSEPATPARARARAMEFGRSVFTSFRARQIARGEPEVDLDRRARALVATWFGREVPDGDYMIEVFEGR